MLFRLASTARVAVNRPLSTFPGAGATSVNSCQTPSYFPIYTNADLTAAAIKHRQNMSILLQDDLYKDKKHPIYNFLFTYVFINPKILFQYSPGMDVTVTGVSFKDYCEHEIPSLADWAQSVDSWQLSPPPDFYSPKQLAGFTSTLNMLRKIQSRAPLLNCFGLHEWAMLYRPSSAATRGDEKTTLSKFQDLPLRLSHEDIAAVLATNTLRCTHFDAFRFFTPDAVPLNKVTPPPCRSSVARNDQPGCVHVTMDLFKWTIKIFPFCSSDLLFDSLALAIAAREVDMRASPYDLTCYQQPQGHSQEGGLGVALGLGGGLRTEPIRVELPEGRKEYQRHQEQLFRQASEVRARLIRCYDRLLSQHTSIKAKRDITSWRSEPVCFIVVCS